MLVQGKEVKSPESERLPEVSDTTIYVLQKMLPTGSGRLATVIVGYTVDEGWAEKWRSRETPSHPRFVIPVSKIEGAP